MKRGLPGAPSKPERERMLRLKARYETRLQEAARSRQELEKRIFHLKTLYDLSREIGSLSDTAAIIQNLLMMVLGTFGVERGLIVLHDAAERRIEVMTERGLDDAAAVARALAEHHVAQPLASVDLHICIPFEIDENLKGGIGLGEKLTGEPYTPDDSELLVTLANQAAVAIRNARAHAEVVRYAKELAVSLRRIQILESMKANLAKFVPQTVKALIEKSPEAPLLERREADVSVLFADITGYTRLSANMEIERLNQLVELHFGAFLDEILRLGGDVNETAGDGLMVIFQDPQAQKHAAAAVQAGLAILRRTRETNATLEGYYEPITMHIGVNSGVAAVGATKIEGAAGTRWTYTASGITTNIAARLAALAEGGCIVLSEETRRRVGDEFELTDMGLQPLKNVAQPVRAYRCSLPTEISSAGAGV
jgi:class 3 adenylate cyclase